MPSSNDTRDLTKNDSGLPQSPVGGKFESPQVSNKQQSQISLSIPSSTSSGTPNATSYDNSNLKAPSSTSLSHEIQAHGTFKSSPSAGMGTPRHLRNLSTAHNFSSSTLFKSEGSPKGPASAASEPDANPPAESAIVEEDEDTAISGAQNQRVSKTEVEIDDIEMNF